MSANVARAHARRVGIIGAGITGMCLAERLSAGGHRVTVLEQASQLGGLTTHHDYGSFIWDRFYHVILPSDTALIDYLGVIGLSDELRWRKTLTGFYLDGKMYGLSNALDFLRFPPLTLWDKIRLGFTLLYCARVTNWGRLEELGVEPWLRKLSGEATYSKIWKPLLLAKLGQSYRDVSAVFIWSYIRRMYSARTAGTGRENLGHVAGGYKTVFDRLRSHVENRGGEVRTETTVEAIAAHPGGGIDLRMSRLGGTGAETHHFDKVIFTGSTQLLRKLAGPEVVAVERSGRSIEYLGVVCPALVTRSPLTPFYVTNIGDPSIGFTGVVGMSSLVDRSQTNGRFLTYFPTYVKATDPAFQRPDEHVRAEVERGIRCMFPEFDLADIESVHINRAPIVQPLQVLGYSKLVPKVATRHADFYVLNTTQFVDDTLNNNAAVGASLAFVKERAAEFATTRMRGRES